MALAAPAAAQAGVVAESASIGSNSLSEFTQVTQLNATVSATSERAYDGSYAVKSVYGGGGVNAYARGHWDVSWQTGNDVWYGAAYYLPTGFKAAMQNEVALMRWDNWPSYQDGSGDIGGIVIWGSDKRARLKLGTYSGSTEKVLAGPFDVPEGRWFWLEVHQKLGTSGALSEVYLDGALVGSSTAANTNGRTIERIRYGLVAQGGSSQTNPLTLYFDRARVSTSATGPLGTAPVPAPSPGTGTGTGSTPSPTPAPANAAPTVSITAPTAGARFGKSLLLEASASDDVHVAKVEFRIDGRLVATDSVQRYSSSVSTRKLSDGTHTISATAYDDAGLKASTSVQAVKGAAALASAAGTPVTRAVARSARCARAMRALKRRHGARAAARAAHRASVCKHRAQRARMRRAVRSRA
jgi:hypothetical protein